MNNWCICWFLRILLLGILISKGLTARRLYKSSGVKGLNEDISRFDLTLSYAFCQLPYFGQLTCVCDSVCQRYRNCTGAFFADSEVHVGRTHQSHIFARVLPHIVAQSV
jgi:hypothetical protein